jgi:hypothetical protein
LRLGAFVVQKSVSAFGSLSDFGFRSSDLISDFLRPAFRRLPIDRRNSHPDLRCLAPAPAQNGAGLRRLPGDTT